VIASVIRAIGLILLGLVATVSVKAQEPASPDPDGNLINYAYAYAFGNGNYAVAGRSAQVFKLPFAIRLLSMEDNPVGLRLKLPVTFGFYEFGIDDLFQGGFADQLQTVSFVPGLEMEVAVNDRWRLLPFIDFGAGKEMSGDALAGILAVGVKSNVTVPSGNNLLTIGNELFWVGSKVHGVRSDAMGYFMTGLDLRMPMKVKLGTKPMNISLYAVNYLYFNDVEFQRDEAEPVTVDTEYEVGMTFGTEPAHEWWIFKAPRVGLSYRFGGQISAVRLTLGQAF
jgi:hypothetical protein